jgi:hypothetical protein
MPKNSTQLLRHEWLTLPWWRECTNCICRKWSVQNWARFHYNLWNFLVWWQIPRLVLVYATKKQEEVLGRTNRLLSLIWHGPHWKRRVQQFFYCCMCIRYRGNVSTEPLPSNDRGIFTEPLPSNDRRIHRHTQRATWSQSKESRLKMNLLWFVFLFVLFFCCILPHHQGRNAQNISQLSELSRIPN